jgi:hypothetical protein
MARIQDILDNKCLNCLQPQETSQHLNRCPDKGCTLLFKDSVGMLLTWMHENDRTDQELAYWIKKDLLFWGTRSFSTLVESGGPAPPHIWAAAASQNLIGWVEFLHGKVSIQFWTIQDTHCALSSCRTMGEDWMKVFVSHLIQMSHLQWIFCNFTLHDKQRGYPSLLEWVAVLKEVERLLDTSPEDILAGSQYLLESDYSALYNAYLERQLYWVLAMKAACWAGRRVSEASKSRGRTHRRLQAKMAN